MTAHSVGYAVLPDGYEAVVYDRDLQPVYEYRAGNHPLDSYQLLAADDPRRVPNAKLLAWAKQTARDLAKEYGVRKKRVFHDTDREEAFQEELA